MKDLEELFREWTLPVNNAPGYRCMTFIEFKTIIENITEEQYNRGYYRGIKENDNTLREVYKLL